jgi:hypothetical protein
MNRTNDEEAAPGMVKDVEVARPSLPESRRVVFLLLAALCLYHVVFGVFFPNASGEMGNDYSFMLPHLLAGHFWAATNGIFEVPWFTPAFCGGLPHFPDPQSFFYSVPQWLSFVMPPSSAVYGTVLSFAALGFLGMWTLLRRGFGFGPAASEAGALLFMCNGFFASRMIVGHLTFHAFMLLPWLVAFLVMPRRHHGPTWPRDVVNGVFAGLCGAYFVHSGMLVILLPVIYAALVILGVWALRTERGLPWRAVVLRTSVACLVALGLSASRLVSSLSFLASFERSDYPFPMVHTLGDVLSFGLQSLFLPVRDLATDVSSALATRTWNVDRHELEYGLGPLAALILLAGVAFRLLRRREPSVRRARPIWLLVILGLALVLPLALNLFEPSWHAFLKTIPVLKSSSILFRWYLVFIPIVVIASAHVVASVPTRFGSFVSWGVLACIGLGFSMGDFSSYHGGRYDPGPVDRASARLAETHCPPPVSWVIAADSRQAPNLPEEALRFPNDSLMAGATTVSCFNGIFGYRLEHLPLNGIRSGLPDEVIDGRLNFKNPACYVWPAANSCAPGEHFRNYDALALERLLRYSPFSFAVSDLQQIADVASAVSVSMVFGIALIALCRWLIRLRQSPGATPASRDDDDRNG